MTMTTIQLLKSSGADAHEAHLVCECGQDLDTCRRAHCPRCGCTLSDTHDEPWWLALQSA